MTKVSVVVPVHNSERYLDACVLSVAAQTGCAVELVLVDDNSTDNSFARMGGYVSRYPEVEIKCLRSTGTGVSDARNTGIGAATGDYIAFLDSDDELAHGGLQELLGLFDRFPKADIAVGQFKDTGNLRHPVCIASSTAIKATLYQYPGFHESACAKLYRRSLFDGTVRFEHGRRYEDLEFCPDIYAKASEIAFTGKIVYRYVYNPDSFINTWSDTRTDALWAVDNIAAKHGSRYPGAVRNRRFSAYYNIFNLAVANNRPEIAMRCWKELRKMRAAILGDRHCRSKNRIGAAVAMLGLHSTRLISKIHN